MFIPLRTDSRLRSTPYMNWVMIGLNVLFWLAQIMGGASARSPGGEVEWWSRFTLGSDQPELFHFVSYGFLHAGFLHLAGNMLFLYIFGNNVNDKMGHIGYLAFYLAGVIFSGITYVVFDKAGIPVLGASGAVSAVVGAYLVLFPRAKVTVFVFFLVIGAFEIPSLWFILAFFLKDVIGLSGESNVAHSAHVGGTVFGVAVCTAMLALNLLPRDQFDIISMVRQWNRRRQYRDAVSSGWDPYGTSAPPGRADYYPSPMSSAPDFAPPNRFVQPEVSIDPRQRQVLDLRAKISDAIRTHDLPRAVNLYGELKSFDPANVLPRQLQLDVANQLAAEQRYPQAAEAYETFLANYPKYEQAEQLELMVGLIQARFLNQPSKARDHLKRAMEKLTNEQARSMAREELDKIAAIAPV